MTAEYEQALNAVREATRTFYALRDAYHSLKIGDDEFLAAKAVYDEAEKAFDVAFAKEERLEA